MDMETEEEEETLETNMETAEATETAMVSAGTTTHCQQGTMEWNGDQGTLTDPGRKLGQEGKKETTTRKTVRTGKQLGI